MKPHGNVAEKHNPQMSCRAGIVSGTCHKHAQVSMHKVSVGDFNEQVILGWSQKQFLPLTSTWILFTWQFQSCHPNSWGLQILKSHQTSGQQAPTLENSLHIRLWTLTSSWTCTEELLYRSLRSICNLCLWQTVFL